MTQEKNDNRLNDHITEQERKSSLQNVSCCAWIICVYAGTVTGAFVAVTVLGVLQLQTVTERFEKLEVLDRPPPPDINHLNSEALTSPTSNQKVDNREIYRNIVKRYTLRDDYLDMTELVEINAISGKASFYFPATLETNSGVAVIDYHKHLGGIHIAGGKDRCYLIQDMDRHFPDVVKLQTFLEAGKPTRHHKSAVNLDYEISSLGSPVADLDSIPTEIHSMCWGKTIHWLRQVGSLREETKDQLLHQVMGVITIDTTTLFITIIE